MDFKKSKAILKKINALHDSAIDFEGSITSMEKDLLLQYLRDLYEVILQDESVKKSTPDRNDAQEVAEIVVQKTSPPIQTYRSIDTTTPQRPQSEVGIIPDSAPSYPNVITAKQEGGKKKEKLAALFDHNESKDLSSKFGSLPISDIAKSMGINDKILTINELFGGDQQLFNSVVQDLNLLNSFEEAKDYLVKGVAKKQAWYEDDKKEMAATFIKLIRRRYI